MNAELVVLTYGTIVAQLCKDFDGDYVQVNKQLDKMGYNIGLRLIEDYLAKSNTMRRCSNFRETADMLAKVLNGRSKRSRPLQDDSRLTVNAGRLGLRSFSTSHRQLRIGRATASSSPLYSMRTPWRTLLNCLMTAERRTSCGTPTYSAACCEAHWRWCRRRSKHTS